MDTGDLRVIGYRVVGSRGGRDQGVVGILVEVKGWWGSGVVGYRLDQGVVGVWGSGV